MALPAFTHGREESTLAAMPRSESRVSEPHHVGTPLKGSNRSRPERTAKSDRVIRPPKRILTRAAIEQGSRLCGARPLGSAPE